jgi:hypothetical protein
MNNKSKYEFSRYSFNFAKSSDSGVESESELLYLWEEHISSLSWFDPALYEVGRNAVLEYIELSKHTKRIDFCRKKDQMQWYSEGEYTYIFDSKTHREMKVLRAA